MVELSKNSTNLKPKKETPKVNVKEDKTPNSTSASCDLTLDKERLKDILENIPSAAWLLKSLRAK